MKKTHQINLSDLPDIFDENILAETLNKSVFWIQWQRWLGKLKPDLRIGRTPMYKRESVVNHFSCNINNGEEDQ